jgi:hypothetical protein
MPNRHITNKKLILRIQIDFITKLPFKLVHNLHFDFFDLNWGNYNRYPELFLETLKLRSNFISEAISW